MAYRLFPSFLILLQNKSSIFSYAVYSESDRAGENSGVFQSTKNSGLNFREISISE